jgi:hypothetical protein
VNARDAGIHVTVAAENRGGNNADSKADARLMRLRFVPPGAQQALAVLFAQIEPSTVGAPRILDSPQQRYAAERAAIDNGIVIPLAFVPELCAVNSAVKDWLIPRWGGWDLDGAWLDQSAHAAAGAKSNTP